MGQLTKLKEMQTLEQHCSTYSVFNSQVVVRISLHMGTMCASYFYIMILYTFLSIKSSEQPNIVRQKLLALER